ncbi:MAG: response regulator [Myxococcota bacterium]
MTTRLRRRAIIVDDSRAMRALLRRGLQSFGFDVVGAGEGREALKLLTTTRIPEIALVDWNMPGMDGLTLIEVLREDPAYDEMKIVMVSSESAPDRIERALRAGADDYIMKPFSSEALAERLQGLGLVLHAPS